MNGQAAIATLFYGLISATLRIVLELMKDSLSGFPLSFATINFSHFAIFNFLVCAAVAIVVSLATAPPNELQLAGLTISTLSPEQRQANRDSYSKVDVAISLLLAVIVISILIYFRG